MYGPYDDNNNVEPLLNGKDCVVIFAWSFLIGAYIGSLRAYLRS